MTAINVEYVPDPRVGEAGVIGREHAGTLFILYNPRLPLRERCLLLAELYRAEECSPSEGTRLAHPLQTA